MDINIGKYVYIRVGGQDRHLIWLAPLLVVPGHDTGYAYKYETFFLCRQKKKDALIRRVRVSSNRVAGPAGRRWDTIAAEAKMEPSGPPCMPAGGVAKP